MTPPRSVAAFPAHVGGGLLAGASFGLAALRRFTAKPLHPRGAVVEATLTRSRVQDRARASGVAWIDGAGVDRVLARTSRAVGLPARVPDVHGLALRVPTGPGRHGDLLLASTGWGGVGRFFLTASRVPTARPLTTLLPYRTAGGPVLIGAEHMDGDGRVRLSWARLAGPWHAFAVLELPAAPGVGADASVDFDPVRCTLPGLETYAWVRRVREPAYATARAARSSRGVGRRVESRSRQR
ncbi:hypothetical protein KV102_02085 [Mumia sp. zg.B53]|uniref:hypothetical protein n=1 Tax=Mumia sp. zg.B53 TaxID=2855449 RepID=UPI001C6DE04D|nr:hypothetical protein [Mumia sp. zg.B53]MBW9213620.1 hypothetical protein [Mumia sp. zg.B53]